LVDPHRKKTGEPARLELAWGGQRKGRGQAMAPAKTTIGGNKEKNEKRLPNSSAITDKSVGKRGVFHQPVPLGPTEGKRGGKGESLWKVIVT